MQFDEDISQQLTAAKQKHFMSDFLKCNFISKSTGSNLKGLNLSISRHVKTAIIGETGSGKSSLLKLMAGLLQPDEGEIFFEGKKLKGPEEVLIPGHPEISYLSQHFELFNNYYVHELLEYASKISNEEANRIFQICEISHLLDRKTDQLSGGERQRIAFARQLVRSPKLLLLDEPFSNLDMVHKQMIKRVIHHLTEELKLTCVMVSHDPEDILSWADDIIILHQGTVLQKGNPKNLYYNPVNEYAASLLGTYNHIPVDAPWRKALLLNDSKNEFVRPEMLLLTKGTNPHFDLFVKQIQFCGDHYKVHVGTENINIVVSAESENFRIGDIVNISLKRGY